MSNIELIKNDMEEFKLANRLNCDAFISTAESQKPLIIYFYTSKLATGNKQFMIGEIRITEETANMQLSANSVLDINTTNSITFFFIHFVLPRYEEDLIKQTQGE